MPRKQKTICSAQFACKPFAWIKGSPTDAYVYIGVLQSRIADLRRRHLRDIHRSIGQLWDDEFYGLTAGLVNSRSQETTDRVFDLGLVVVDTYGHQGTNYQGFL
jgi:hypothetical protein